MDRQIEEMEAKFRQEVYEKEQEIKALKEKIKILEIQWSVVEMIFK